MFEFVLSLRTMPKGSAKSSKLKQARLVGINDHVKSVQQKSTGPPTSNSTLGGLRQSGLAAFGFGVRKDTLDRRDVIEIPPPKRRKKLVADLEVPETQFALNTQSPELSDYDPFATSSEAVFREDGYSSPLSSPPSEVSSPSPISSFVAMPPPPPPAAPVTPKRRRVIEVPDSKSPPVTPFTPYASQQQDDWLDSQPSPIAHKNISPFVQPMEGYLGSDIPTPTSSRVVRQRLFTSGSDMAQQDKGDEGEAHKEKVGGMGDAAEWVEVVFEDRDRIIKSSQWWENEDTQNVSLSMQEERDIGHDSALQDFVQDDESFRVDLSYKSELAENTDEKDGTYESQADSEIDLGGNDMQESFHSMTYPVLGFRGDTPEPEPIMGDDRIDEDFPSPTANQEDAEGVDKCNESQEYPVYGAYRTQQFPSSFYQHSSYRLSSPEIPPSSQFAPVIDNELCSAGKDDNRGQGGALLLPRVIEKGPDARDEEDGTHDKEGLPQRFPELVNRSNTAAREDLQCLPVLINMLDALARGEVDYGDHEDGQDIQDISIKDDNEGKGQVGWRDGTVTRSQLLPSELMETFPMPPPLSQFSSCGPYGYEYDESETQ